MPSISTLFILYVKDIEISLRLKSSNNYNVKIYADHILLYYIIYTIISISDINVKSNRIYDWLYTNKLKMNTRKTKYICFNKSNTNFMIIKLNNNNTWI